jgi:hypothetical protein
MEMKRFHQILTYDILERNDDIHIYLSSFNNYDYFIQVERIDVYPSINQVMVYPHRGVQFKGGQRTQVS